MRFIVALLLLSTSLPLLCNAQQTCSAGYYRDGNCRLCYSGSYCPGSNKVLTCPSGSYCPSGSSSPKTCPSGSYCPYGSSSPTACPSGSYCLYGSWVPTTCPSGSYCPSGSSAPTKCPSGSYCTDGLSWPKDCPSGSYCTSGSSLPTGCPSGSYCPYGSSEPTTCSDNGGTFCPYGSSWPQTCYPGWYCPTNREAWPCVAGFYCPSGSFSQSLCPIGSYCPWYSSSPVSCSTPGTFCTSSGLAAPTLCPAGRYCPSPVDAPLICPIGSYCPAGSATHIRCTRLVYCNDTGLSRPSSTPSYSATAAVSMSETASDASSTSLSLSFSSAATRTVVSSTQSEDHSASASRTASAATLSRSTSLSTRSGSHSATHRTRSFSPTAGAPSATPSKTVSNSHSWTSSGTPSLSMLISHTSSRTMTGSRSQSGSRSTATQSASASGSGPSRTHTDVLSPSPTLSRTLTCSRNTRSPSLTSTLTRASATRSSSRSASFTITVTMSSTPPNTPTNADVSHTSTQTTVTAQKLLTATVVVTMTLRTASTTRSTALPEPVRRAADVFVAYVADAVSQAMPATAMSLSATTVGRLGAVRSVTLCRGSEDDIAGVLDLKVSWSGTFPQPAVEAAARTIIGNVAVVAMVNGVLLAGAAVYAATHRGDGGVPGLLRVGLPSSGVAAWIAVMPSTTLAVVSLLRWSRRDGASAAVVLLIGGGLAVVLIPVIWLVMVFTRLQASMGLVCALRTAEQRDGSSLLLRLFGERARPLHELVSRKCEWRCDRPEMEVRARSMRILLLEYRGLWYPAFDVGILLAANVISGSATSSASLLICTGAAATLALLYLLQLGVVLRMQPFTTRMSTAVTVATLLATAVSTVMQLVHITRSELSSASTRNAAGLSWPLVVAAVCDLLVLGVAICRMICLDLPLCTRAVATYGENVVSGSSNTVSFFSKFFAKPSALTSSSGSLVVVYSVQKDNTNDNDGSDDESDILASDIFANVAPIDASGAAFLEELHSEFNSSGAFGES